MFQGRFALSALEAPRVEVAPRAHRDDLTASFDPATTLPTYVRGAELLLEALRMPRQVIPLHELNTVCLGHGECLRAQCAEKVLRMIHMPESLDAISYHRRRTYMTSGAEKLVVVKVAKHFSIVFESVGLVPGRVRIKLDMFQRNATLEADEVTRVIAFVLRCDHSSPS